MYPSFFYIPPEESYNPQYFDELFLHFSRRGDKFYDLPLFCFDSLSFGWNHMLKSRVPFEREIQDASRFQFEYIMKCPPEIISYSIPHFRQLRRKQSNRLITRYSNFISNFNYYYSLQINPEVTFILDLNYNSKESSSCQSLILCNGCIATEQNQVLMTFCLRVEDYMKNVRGKIKHHPPSSYVLWISEELFSSSYGKIGNTLFKEVIKPCIINEIEVKIFTKKEMEEEFNMSNLYNRKQFKETLTNFCMGEESFLDFSELESNLIRDTRIYSDYLKL